MKRGSPGRKLRNGFLVIYELPMSTLSVTTQYKRFIRQYAPLLTDWDKERVVVFARDAPHVDCLCCQARGERLVISKDKGNQLHVDIYTATYTLLTIDHILPRAKGGKDELNNYQILCTVCNSWKSDKAFENTEAMRSAHHQTTSAKQRMRKFTHGKHSRNAVTGDKNNVITCISTS